MDTHTSSTPDVAHARVVTATLDCDLIDALGAVIPIQADLLYDASDAFALTATFHTAAARSVRWVFARDLVLDGTFEPIGDGDVHVWPCLDDRARAVVFIELCSPHGEALIQIPSASLAAFNARMTTAVPRGSETYPPDFEDALMALLADNDAA